FEWCCVGWVKSQLFWKIVGLYALLSLLALVGLLVTLNARLSRQATAQEQHEIQQTLRAILTELKNSGDDQRVISSWRNMLRHDGQEVWLVDARGRTL